MHWRRFASLLLGAWMMGTLFMAYVATQNFRSVDRLMAEPSLKASLAIHALGTDNARLFLRYQVAEQNRFYFENWERAELLLTVGLALTLLLGTHANRLALVLSALLVLITLFLHFVITPEVTYYGRLLDFVPAGAPAPDRSRFWTLHGTYSGLMLLKLAMGAALGWYLMTLKSKYRKSSRRNSADEVAVTRGS